MSVKYGVELDVLDAAITDMTAFQTRLEHQLTHLDGAVADLHVTWVGDAADAQRTAHAAWTHGARTMHAALGEMIAAARLAHGNYTAAVTANTTMWRSVR